MVNEIALVLLFGLFGWKIALLYMSTGLAIAMVSGWVIGRLKWNGLWKTGFIQMQLGSGRLQQPAGQLAGTYQLGLDAVRDIVGKVWPYVLAGIAVGAGIHGYVPENFMASIMGKSAWWAVPVAVVIGIPMYSNAAGHYSGGAGAAWQRRSAGNRACLHDGGHWPFSAGDHYFAKSA